VQQQQQQRAEARLAREPLPLMRGAEAQRIRSGRVGRQPAQHSRGQLLQQAEARWGRLAREPLRLMRGAEARRLTQQHQMLMIKDQRGG
jgi:hypothetical protein